MARMLIVFSKLMQSNYVYHDLFILSDFSNRELARSFLKLLKADNVLITYLSGQCLKRIMQFGDSSETHQERRNKESMISKSSVNIMKYLTRSLLVNDRYQKLHNGQVKCHM